MTQITAVQPVLFGCDAQVALHADAAERPHCPWLIVDQLRPHLRELFAELSCRGGGAQNECSAHGSAGAHYTSAVLRNRSSFPACRTCVQDMHLPRATLDRVSPILLRSQGCPSREACAACSSCTSSKNILKVTCNASIG